MSYLFGHTSKLSYQSCYGGKANKVGIHHNLQKNEAMVNGEFRLRLNNSVYHEGKRRKHWESWILVFQL